MAIGSHLRAASHQRVRIDHGPIARPASGVDVHRRHTRDASADVAAIANTGAAGNDADAAVGRYVLHWECRFVEPGQSRGVDRHIHHRAHAKSQEDSFFHPSVHPPAGFRGLVGFGRANLTCVQRLFEALEEMKMIVGVRGGWLVEKLFDLSLHARSGRLADPVLQPPLQSLRDWPDLAGIAAAATPAPAIPSAPWRTSRESDSTPRSSLPSAAGIAAATRGRLRSRSPMRAG